MFLVTAMKQKAKYKFHVALMLFYILQTNYFIKSYIFFEHVLRIIISEAYINWR